jgi:hypothetical protein
MRTVYVILVFAFGVAACDGIAGIQTHTLPQPDAACGDTTADGSPECGLEGDGGPE